MLKRLWFVVSLLWTIFVGWAMLGRTIPPNQPLLTTTELLFIGWPWIVGVIVWVAGRWVLAARH